MKKCCVIGHNPDKFPWDYENKESIEYQEYVEATACYIDYIIRKKGYINFVCDNGNGVAYDFAETVESLKYLYPNISIERADISNVELITASDLVLFFLNGANDVTFGNELILAKSLNKEIEIFRLDEM